MPTVELSRSPIGHFVKPLPDPRSNQAPAVSEVKRPTRNRFSEAASCQLAYNGFYLQRPLPNGHNRRPFGCDVHASAVAVGKRKATAFFVLAVKWDVVGYHKSQTFSPLTMAAVSEVKWKPSWIQKKCFKNVNHPLALPEISRCNNNNFQCGGDGRAWTWKCGV
jgi:hypothetical protein